MNSINVAVIFLFAASVSARTLSNSIPDCPVICPRIFDPICASNGNDAVRLFHSECHMKMTNCKDVSAKNEVFIPREMELCTHAKQIKTLAERSSCAQVCPMVFNPICATNGKETKLFNNECFLEMTNCRNVFGKANVFTACELNRCQTDKVEIKKSSLQSVPLLSHCPIICPQIYMPICASNDKETKRFSSECHMHQANCKQINGGKVYMKRDAEICDMAEATKPLTATFNSISKPSLVLPKTTCLRPCPKIYRPICAINGRNSRTFSNECVMNNHNCMTNENWLMTRSEQC